ncbi:thiamine diphosphokinase [Paenibacillus sp. FSL H7-0326]|uniref:thiamine diphosphokinase n=1 Tax=Paenibacillus sp. FSL H7-0326 TaxID=1921144 RepID=UPI00096CEEC3|nr:thiamine diphosphokinase [Paenibacillus sp. FSL H7-0326]OMC68412.1 thiamine diphosphokinase [Paenibacillus sp. FSL H7-0326]
MLNTRVAIFTGGELHEEYIEKLNADDILIGADYGAWYLVNQQLKPTIAVGDFDSVSEEQYKRIEEYSHQVVRCDPIDKDLSDTELALKYAYSFHPSEIVIFGATGSRLDHTLANIQILSKTLKQGVRCSIINRNNLITATDSRITLHKSEYDYISLIPLTTEVRGIDLDGFMYPLSGAVLSIGDSLGISNQIVNSTGTIRIKEGILLVIQSKD